jgi:hypothetical protein
MEKSTEKQCPNCWGYQEYNEELPERKLCECKAELNK